MVDDAIPMAILARFGTKNEFLLHTGNVCCIIFQVLFIGLTSSVPDRCRASPCPRDIVRINIQFA